MADDIEDALDAMFSDLRSYAEGAEVGPAMRSDQLRMVEKLVGDNIRSSTGREVVVVARPSKDGRYIEIHCAEPTVLGSAAE